MKKLSEQRATILSPAFLHPIAVERTHLDRRDSKCPPGVFHIDIVAKLPQPQQKLQKQNKRHCQMKGNAVNLVDSSGSPRGGGTGSHVSRGGGGGSDARFLAFVKITVPETVHIAMY